MTKSTNITPVMAVRIFVEQEVMKRYNGSIPARIDFVESPVFAGFSIEVKIPGQSRVVHVTPKQINNLSDTSVLEEIADDVKYALYLLLDEDEDAE